MYRPSAWRSTIAIIFLAVIAITASIDIIRLKQLYTEYYSSPDKVGGEYWLSNKRAFVTNATIPLQLPGPLDTWAGGESKSIVIPLHSDRPFRIEIHLLDSHEAAPPTIQVASAGRADNYQVKPGKGATPDLWEKEGKRSLVVGELAGARSDPQNIEISSTSGSWAVIERIVIKLKPYSWEPILAVGSWLALALLCGSIIFNRWRLGTLCLQLRVSSLVNILLNDDARPLYGYSLSVLVFTVSFLAAHYKLAIGWNMPVWDAYDYAMPHYILLADYIRAGKLFMWNPYGAGGIPAFIDPGVGAFSPLTLCFAFITGGTYLGYNAHWLFLLWLGGCGIILLARQYNSPPWGGVVAALGFVFSGYHTGHSEHTPCLYAFAFLPFIIYMLETAFDRVSYMRAVIAGGLFGVAGLGGIPGVIILMSGYFAVWMAVRIWDTNRPHRIVNVGYYIKSMTLFYILSAIIMAPVYLGFLIEGAGFTARTGYMSRADVTALNALHPAALGSFTSPAFPMVKYNVGNSILWGSNDLSSFSIYICPIVFIFGVLSVALNPGSLRRWWIFGLGLSAIALSLGDVLPFRGWLYDIAIPTRYFRHASMIRGFYLFSITALSLYAFKDIREILAKDERSSLKVILGGTIAMTTIAVMAYLYLMSSALGVPLAKGYWMAHIHFFWIWGVAICIAIMMRRWPVKLRLALPLSLIAITAIDAFMNVRISDGVISKEVSSINPHYYQAHDSRLDLTADNLKWEWGDIRNSNFSAKYQGMLSYGPMLFSNHIYASLVNSPIAKDNLIGMTRLWFSANPNNICPSAVEYDRIKDHDDFWLLFQNTIHERNAMAGDYSVCPPSKDFNLAPQSPKQINASLKSHTPMHINFAVTAPDDGYVTISERWTRSWRAKVNNVETPLLGGSFIFRSVKVAKGHNEIEMRYEPEYALWALAISYLTLAGIFGLGIARLARRWN